jgi:SAM-dependent methyltransferase
MSPHERPDGRRTSDMAAAEWDARYREKELVWGVEPNRWVAAELGTTRPGTAVDLACGEGRNARWLAALGWQVIGVDFSPVAIDKARTLAAGRDSVDWVVADARSYRPPAPVDLALLCYLQLRAAQRREALRSAADALGPGGILLVVAHDSRNLAEGTGGPQDPGVLYTAEDVRRDLEGTAVTVTRGEAVYRPVAGAPRPAIDVLVRGERRAG